MDEDKNGYLDLLEFGAYLFIAMTDHMFIVSGMAHYFYEPYPSKYSHIFGKFHDLDTYHFGNFPIPEHMQRSDKEAIQE